ncbi:DNA-binding transcriptional regulator DsdC [Chromobacterium phragmitis]|uniref:DNA-binding transcriptional regulator DsdC n=1 Tax=Chromobacterium phragmitis TaxID=2202141 RepID=UPI000DED2038|nr:DNA-binding transcriptional regulator DsdC [Chromobacterium phragmitis]AXE32013.1 DNA-binding transcriptional regulator DsdC [Chromobacterium phragmitis]
MLAPKLDGGQLANLHTFMTVARRMSFAAAAAELCLTPSAVSHRIARLERALDLRLFQRLTRSIRLTADGERILAALEAGLAEIESALSPAAGQEPVGRVALHAHPSIAQCWLAPRLAEFADRHPRIALDIRTGNEDPDFRGGRADLALCYSDGHFPGLASIKLMDEEMAPVCSPGYAERHALSGAPERLAGCRLLHDAQAWRHAAHDAEWMLWAQRRGCEASLPQAGLTLDRSDLCLAGAAGHAGVAIGRRRLAQPLLDSGQLMLPLGGFEPAERYAYYLAYPLRAAPSPPLQAVIDWLRRCANADMSQSGN